MPSGNIGIKTLHGNISHNQIGGTIRPGSSGRLPAYEGEYEITSSAQIDQTLATENKSLYENVIVLKNETSTSPTPGTTGSTFIIY